MMITRVGDVLILAATTADGTHVVGAVSYDGQQDFTSRANVVHVSGRKRAEVEAIRLLMPGRRIYFKNGGEWTEVPH
jgi:hypothetical protein